MSMNATITSQAVQEWVKIFPRQATETYTSSVIFMKQLTVIAVSTITYLKNIFPEESFTVEHFGGVKVRILKKRCRDELAQFVSTALTQAFEAFEKKYLHQLAVCFYEGGCESDKLLEYHVFEYRYNVEGAGVSMASGGGGEGLRHKYTFETLRDRTLHLIKACVVTLSDQNALPDTYDICIRLYYNDDAPAGYQAPGFAAGGCAALSGGAMLLGAVRTRHHRLLASAYKPDHMPSSNHANPSSTAPEVSQYDDEDFDEVRSVFESSTTSQSEYIQCPCNKTDFDDDTLMFTCQYCSRQQHAVCYGYKSVPPQQCCVKCSDGNPSLKPTDARLVTLSVKKRECLCIFRRALRICERQNEVSTAMLEKKFGMTHLSATKLMKLLYSQGILLADGGNDVGTLKKVIPNQLETVMRKYFEHDYNMKDNLLSESLSQRTDNNYKDPVGDVLAPMEKVSLQNATAPGTIVDPQLNTTNADHVTLQEYKNTILNNNMDDDMPLSAESSVKQKENIKQKTTKRKYDEQLRSGVKTKRVKTTNNI